MKKLLILLALTGFAITGIQAQKLTIGERASEIKSTRKLGSKQTVGQKAKVVEFFHCTNKHCADRVQELERIASTYADRLEVTIVTRESAETVEKLLRPGSSSYLVAVDSDGKIFESYGVRYVPFAVLIDKKGKVIWFGNSASLTEEMIRQVI